MTQDRYDGPFTLKKLDLDGFAIFWVEEIPESIYVPEALHDFFDPEQTGINIGDKFEMSVRRDREDDLVLHGYTGYPIGEPDPAPEHKSINGRKAWVVKLVVPSKHASDPTSVTIEPLTSATSFDMVAYAVTSEMTWLYSLDREWVEMPIPGLMDHVAVTLAEQLETALQENEQAVDYLREFHHVEGEPLSETAAVVAESYRQLEHRLNTLTNIGHKEGADGEETR